MVQSAQPSKDESLVTVQQAARRLGVGVRQLRRARDRGELPVYRVGAWERVKWSEVTNWVRSKRVEPSSGLNTPDAMSG